MNNITIVIVVKGTHTFTGTSGLIQFRVVYMVLTWGITMFLQ